MNHEVQTLGALGSHDPNTLERYSFLHKGSRPGLHEPSDGSRAIIPDLNRVSGKVQYGYKVYGVILKKEYSQGAFPEYYEKLKQIRWFSVEQTHVADLIICTENNYGM